MRYGRLGALSAARRGPQQHAEGGGARADGTTRRRSGAACRARPRASWDRRPRPAAPAPRPRALRAPTLSAPRRRSGDAARRGRRQGGGEENRGRRPCGGPSCSRTWAAPPRPARVTATAAARGAGARAYAWGGGRAGGRAGGRGGGSTLFGSTPPASKAARARASPRFAASHARISGCVALEYLPPLSHTQVTSLTQTGYEPHTNRLRASHTHRLRSSHTHRLRASIPRRAPCP